MSNVYTIITDRILSLLNKGCIPWKRPWRTEVPKNLISGKEYRGVNVLLLGSSPYPSPYWLTFNQARGLKGSVKKGEKGCPVIFWKVGEEEDENENGQYHIGSEPVIGKSKPRINPRAAAISNTTHRGIRFLVFCSSAILVQRARPQALKIFSIAFPFANSSTNLSR